MGKVEKVVVLSVLFVISLIVAVSLHTGSPEDEMARNGRGRAALREAPEVAHTVDPRNESSIPLEGAPERSVRPLEYRPVDGDVETRTAALDLDNAPTDAEGVTRPDSVPATAANAGSTLLSSSVRAREAVVEVQSDWDLEDVSQLAATFDPSLLVYRCVRGDSFESVARRLYGDAALADLLQLSNEGVAVLEPGLEIFVPVRDDRGPSAGDYVVQDGESLWVIAEKFYGRGTRWNEIFEANRDLLAKPESVRVGMTLRIP